VNVTYTAGAWIPFPLLFAFVITTSSGEQAAVVNEADAYFLGAYSWIEDIRGFRFGPASDADALALLRELVHELGLRSSAIGIELSYMSHRAFAQVQEVLPAVRWADISSVFENARLIKTDAEIELFGAAAYVTDKAIQTAFALSRPGQTEKELAAGMQSNVLRLGADAIGHSHVHAGVHSTIVHTLSLEQPILAGEVVHVDFGASFAGYATDLSRNAVVDRGSARQHEIYRALWEIEQVLFEKLRPGVRAADVFSEAQQQFDRHGLVHPWGTLGHSTGLAVHEGFEFAERSEHILAPRMIVNIEPSHIERGDARYHIEDTVLITETGNEVLSNFAPVDDLFVIR
jgi:Xaa-Pro aminopeptidase